MAKWWLRRSMGGLRAIGRWTCTLDVRERPAGRQTTRRQSAAAHGSPVPRAPPERSKSTAADARPRSSQTWPPIACAVQTARYDAPNRRCHPLINRSHPQIVVRASPNSCSTTRRANGRRPDRQDAGDSIQSRSRRVRPPCSPLALRASLSRAQPATCDAPSSRPPPSPSRP